MGFMADVFGGASKRTAFTGRREPPPLSRSGSLGSDTAGVWSDNWWSSPSLTGVNVNQQTALQVSAVMACVSIISEDVAKLQPQMWRRRADGGKDPVTDHPLVPLLVRPNDWQTWYEFCQQQISALMLRGNAYTVILRNGRGDPTMLVPINPDKVNLWEAPDGNLFWVVTRTGLHELAVLRSVPLFVPYEDVFHWKGLSGNGLIGVSKISLAREAIGLAAAMEQLASRTIGNGARPSGVLTTDKKVSEEVAKQIKTAWQQNQGGLANGGKLLVLEEGLKWQPLALSFADMQFIASRHYQNADIAKIFRIPNYMIGEDSKVSRANIVQQSQEYLNNTLMSYVDIIEQRFTFTFNLGDDLFVALNLDKILRADIMTRYAAYRIGQSGWLTVNEIRASDGLNPVENGDVIMRPVNMAPIDSDVFLGMAQPDTDPDPNDPDPNDPAADPADDPNAPPPPKKKGPGSEQTGTGGAGGGRPPKDGTDPAPAD